MTALRALVIEPSAVLRQAITCALRDLGGFDVVAVPDGALAEGRLLQKRPDLVVADVDDPRALGLAFIDKHARAGNIPVVVSTCNTAGDEVIRALSRGAAGAVRKSRVELVDANEWARIARRAALGSAGDKRFRHAPANGPSPALIVVGASTGGTHALPRVLSALPRDAPPVLVVQHMVADMTEPFARTLGAACQPEVRVAREGDAVAPGRILLAPGGRHMRASASGDGLVISLDDAPLENGHRPSVDVLFASVAALRVDGVVAVILTGMGNDGADGMAALRAAGAITIAQDEETSTVFGMPKRAIEKGAVDMVLPLGDIGPVMVASARRGGASARTRSA